jgi:ubiquinone/menaquinone biosynthesis C-methylase UbiE
MKDAMDQPVSDSAFRFMALWYRFRDFLAPRIGVLSEVGIQPGFRVLDFGCGPGSYVSPLAKLVGPNGRMYAMDFHPLAIRSVRRIIRKHHLENVELIQSDGATGLPDSSINAVLLYDTFHDLTEPDRILKELARVLKPEGVLSVIDGYISEEAILSGITRGQRFYLRRKGKKMFIFSKNGDMGSK